MRRSWWPPAVFVVVVVVVAGLACGPSPPPPCLEEPAGEIPAGARAMAAALDELGAVRVRGFSGAAGPGAAVVVRAGELAEDAVADGDGRFDVSLAAEPRPSHVVVETGGVTVTLRARQPADARACVAGEPRAVGTTPNDVDVLACGAGVIALVPTSGDGALEVVPLTGGAAPPAASFAVDAAGRGASPWFAAVDRPAGRAAVTLFGQHAVALVDACAGEVLSLARASELVDVVPALTLAAPYDVDGDGAADAQVTRMLPRHPEGVAFVAGRVLASFVNLLEVGPPARYGPGLVVAFAVDGDELVAAGSVKLPFQNPQDISVDDEGRPWVSCSGVLERVQGTFASTTDGGLVRLDPETLAVAHVVAMGRFAPGAPAFVGERVVVGSLIEPALALLPASATSLDDGVVLSTGTAALESLFAAAPLGGGLVGVTELSTDRVHVVDAAAGELHPWPFTAALALGPGGTAFRGAQAIAGTPVELLAPGVPEAAALLGLSGEVVPLRLWQVLGP